MAVIGLPAVAVLAVVVRAPGVVEFQQFVWASGVWAPVLFVVLQMVITVAPVPRTVFTVVAGVLFGSLIGVLLAVVATVGAAVVAFWLVRLASGRLVERYADRVVVAWVWERLNRRGLLAVVSLRLIPMVPFSLMNYAAGLSGVGFVPYLAGTVVGVLPGTVAIVVLGDAVAGGAPPTALLMVSVVSGVVGLVGALVVARRPRAGMIADNGT